MPLGEVGVMWAGGLGTSAGYVNLPELTQSRYKPDPYVEGCVLNHTRRFGRGAAAD